MRRSSGTCGSRSIIPRWISTAQRTASTTLANSASTPSPVFFTIRPLCSLIFGSTSSRRVRLEAFVGAFFVRPHQPRVPRHVGGEDRGETANRGHCRAAVDCLNQAYAKSVPALAFSGAGAAGLRRRVVVLGRSPVPAAARPDRVVPPLSRAALPGYMPPPPPPPSLPPRISAPLSRE